MKTPPFLLGATLLFWGWQSGLLLAGALMGVVLESARLVKARWELSDEDFNRIWTFCSVLFLAVVVYAFTANDGPTLFKHLLRNPSLANQDNIGTAGARTAIALFRWLPMIFFLFVAAQAYSPREEIPWTTLSLILRWRWKMASNSDRARLSARGVNVAFPYFAVCLFAAGSHPGGNNRYFWGAGALLAWALWSQRCRRFSPASWLATLALALALGFGAQLQLGRIQSYVTRFNAELLLRFMGNSFDPKQSGTSLGRTGRLRNSGNIVIRLKPESSGLPTYLREASYRVFRSPFWTASTRNEDLSEIGPETNGTVVVLLPGKTNTAKVNIACFLEGRNSESGERVGLLPLPAGSGRLENLPAFAVTIKTNRMGVVVAEGPGLVIFDACYGPGATVDSPPDDFQDLNIPPSEKPVIEQILSTLPLSGKSPNEQLQIVNGFFQAQFTYSTRLDKPGVTEAGETPLGRFLLHTRSGHCEYFASATVLLLRQLHIPARYAVGWGVHEASGNEYVVRQRDAHAWCLAWDEQTRTWQDFDTTPPSWVEDESKRASVWQRLSDLGSWIGFQFSKLRWGQTHLRQYLLLTPAPVLLLLLYRILFRPKRKGPHRKTSETMAPAAWPGRDSEFYQVERKLAGRGVSRQPSEPLSTWLQRTAADPLLVEVNDPLQALLRLHYRYRFDPRSLSSSDREELRHQTERVLKAMAGQDVKYRLRASVSLR